MYKAVLFDFFDVIAPDFYKTWPESDSLRKTGEFLTLAREMDGDKISLDEYYTRLSKQTGQSATSLREEFDSRTQLNQEVLELIAKLRQNYLIIALANSPATLVQIILKRHCQKDAFDEIITSGETDYVEPSLIVFEQALIELKLTAAEVVFIDDTPSYVESARSLGIRSVKFSSAMQLKADLSKAGIAID